MITKKIGLLKGAAAGLAGIIFLTCVLPQNACAIQTGADAALPPANSGKAPLEPGKVADAIHNYEKALASDPRNPQLNLHLGIAYSRKGDMKKAVEFFQRAISLKPANLDAHLELGNALASRGDVASAITNYQAAIRIKPDSEAAHYNLGSLYLETRRTKEAVEALNEAVRLKPDFADAHRQLGVAHARSGQRLPARTHLEKAVQLSPNDAMIRQDFAMVLGGFGDAERSMAEYREALRLNPSLPIALNNLAWALAANPKAELRDGKEAVRLAERACELTGNKEVSLLGTLAAAYAEAGRFDEAVTTVEKAISLAESQGQKEVAARNRELLQLYRSKRPWHDPVRSP